MQDVVASGGQNPSRSDYPPTSSRSVANRKLGRSRSWNSDADTAYAPGNVGGKLDGETLQARPSHFDLRYLDSETKQDRRPGTRCNRERLVEIERSLQAGYRHDYRSDAAILVKRGRYDLKIHLRRRRLRRLLDQRALVQRARW